MSWSRWAQQNSQFVEVQCRCSFYDGYAMSIWSIRCPTMPTTRNAFYLHIVEIAEPIESLLSLAAIFALVSISTTYYSIHSDCSTF